MITEYELYSDERTVLHAGTRYLFLGGVVCTNKGRVRLQQKLESSRIAHNLTGEVKWGKASRRHLDAYRDWVRTFFDDAYTRYSVLRINRSDPDWNTFKPRSGRRATNDDRLASAFYQFLLVTFGRLSDSKRWWVFPDAGLFSRESVLERVELLFNRTYKRAFGPKSSRVIRLARSRNSKRSELVQLSDLLLGAESCYSLGTSPESGPRAELVRYYDCLRQDIQATRRRLKKISLVDWVSPLGFVYPK